MSEQFVLEEHVNMEIVPFRVIHFKHSAETKISWCGIWRVSRPKTVSTTNFNDVTCKRCIGIVISRQWARLSAKTQRAMKNSICNLVEKYG
jgi:hypothetical protein